MAVQYGLYTAEDREVAPARPQGVPLLELEDLNGQNLMKKPRQPSTLLNLRSNRSLMKRRDLTRADGRIAYVL